MTGIIEQREGHNVVVWQPSRLQRIRARILLWLYQFRTRVK